MNYEQAFIDYCDERGYAAKDVRYTRTGVYATVTSSDGVVDPSHFTNVYNEQQAGRMLPKSTNVRLSFVDFENEAITGGLIEPDCDHRDDRICEGLGHGRQGWPS